MGERDLGTKTSMMRDRDGTHGDARTPLGDAGDIDGTIAEVLPEEALADQEDVDLEEARLADLHDVPEDDYVQEDSELRGVIDDDPARAADQIEREERESHPRPVVRRAPTPPPR